MKVKPGASRRLQYRREASVVVLTCNQSHYPNGCYKTRVECLTSTITLTHVGSYTTRYYTDLLDVLSYEAGVQDTAPMILQGPILTPRSAIR